MKQERNRKLLDFLFIALVWLVIFLSPLLVERCGQ